MVMLLSPDELEQQRQQSPLAAPTPEAPPRIGPAEQMKLWTDMLRQSGMMPPEQKLWEPDEAQQEDIRKQEILAKGINLARAMSLNQNPQYIDPKAYGDDMRKREQERLNAQWLAEANKAKALREATPDDLLSFMGAQATGFQGSYHDFLTLSGSSGQSTPADILEYEYGEQLRQSDPAGYKRWMESRWRPDAATLGGVRYVNGVPVVSAEVIAQTGATIEGAEKDAVKWAEQDAAFEQEASSALDSLDSTKGLVQSMIDLINANPDMPTGALAGKITPHYNQLVAALDTLSTIATVPALAAAKLQPVSEYELRTIRETFASALRDPKANMAALQQQMKWLDRKVSEWTRKIGYYEEHGTMKGYGKWAVRNKIGTRSAPLANETQAKDEDVGELD